MASFKERKNIKLNQLSNDILKIWEEENTFKKSVENRSEKKPFVFYEGPPSSNGLPGIHHVMARALKDVFCRYKTLKGFRVNRKAGWDTHGLPVELSVEKKLGITKEDIGRKISVEEYNAACKKAVMKYTDVWNDLTKKMGYWVDTNNPYVTYDNKYIESVWWLLNKAYEKNYIYKGYTIQPYSPKAGTGLSSHELNQPGCYKQVKDTSITAQFLLRPVNKAIFNVKEPVFFIAWTTTPWTLPSNTALAVNKKVEYVLVKTANQYTHKSCCLILAKQRVPSVLSSPYVEKNSMVDESKQIPYEIIQHINGEDLIGLSYEQLIPLAEPHHGVGNAFKVIHGDFVSTEDGTGIVHIAPTFGADDAKAAEKAGVPPMLTLNNENELVPLVNLQGKFIDKLGFLSDKFVKNAYYQPENEPSRSVDVEIAIHLKEKNRAFKVEKYEHNYPHCWRTDKPILYYPLDSWFIKVSAFKEKMYDLNQKINWKPASTGEGRFGNWLQNANDWNLSRSRFWGIPLPIWVTEDKKQIKCIGSVEELQKEVEKSVSAGFMKKNPLAQFKPNDFSYDNYNSFDLHKHFVDGLILCSENNEPMYRETDLIDVWFDSGSMPYAQWHYPFENKSLIDEKKTFPADFIAEGVDQTRGWFYTLHAISTMIKEGVAYKNVISNGLVLDKNGQKMSKRLGNAVDPFKTLDQYGPDATRWYMITNSQPWDNLKFDLAGIEEVTRKFFGTLINTYNFFALYANLDEYKPSNNSDNIAFEEIDHWIISKLNSLIKKVNECYDDYEPTKAGRLIQSFVVDELSNWYVRLCRKRFWKGELTEDKKAAYYTLHLCLKEVSILMSPISPFYSDLLYRDLLFSNSSVHLSDFPEPQTHLINLDLEEKMNLCQQVSSLVLSIRKKEKIKVRQPLQKILIPSRGKSFENAIKEVESLILTEVNVKELLFIKQDDPMLKKKLKPNFKYLGPKFGKQMKFIANAANNASVSDITSYESNGNLTLDIGAEKISFDSRAFDVITADVPGWKIANSENITVALDLTISEELKNEGIARDLVNRIQNIRKETQLEVTDFINVFFCANNEIKNAINNNLNYICSETLAKEILFQDKIEKPFFAGENEEIQLSIEKTK